MFLFQSILCNFVLFKKGMIPYTPKAMVQMIDQINIPILDVGPLV